MILDTSAIIAIFVEEPGWERVAEKLAGAPALGIGAPTLAETGLVLAARLRQDPRPALLRFQQELEVAVLPFGEAHWREAVEAFLRFGKGRHPASLSFGDCQTYATAKLARRPLLCVGRDFAKTDLKLA